MDELLQKLSEFEESKVYMPSENSNICNYNWARLQNCSVIPYTSISSIPLLLKFHDKGKSIPSNVEILSKNLTYEDFQRITAQISSYALTAILVVP